MSERQAYEYLIVGGGNGGSYLAWQLGSQGRSVAVLERRWIGGACPNTNCLPTKNVVWSAKVAQLMRHAKEYGAVTGPVSTDMTGVRAHKRAMVQTLIDLTLQLYKDSGAELILGEGRFLGPKTVEVRLKEGGVRVLEAERIYVNLGTHPAIPEVPGLKAAGPLTNIEALELDHVPGHLVVLGGGYVGLELGQALRRFGSAVTVIERAERIAPREDPDVSAELQKILAQEGMQFLTGTTVLRVEGRSGEAVKLSVRTPSGEKVIEATDILSTVGRIPNTAGIGLELAGVELDAQGYVKVDEHLKTTGKHVWGIGESCSGHPQFTHVSYDDFRILSDNLAGGDRSTRARLVPHCLFTDPPLAHIGLTETEARERGIAVRIARLPVAQILRSYTRGELDGFLKVLVAADSDEILGFTMLGPEAGEVMPAVQVAMLGHLPYMVLRDAIIAHPTMAEGLDRLMLNVPPRESGGKQGGVKERVLRRVP